MSQNDKSRRIRVQAVGCEKEVKLQLAVFNHRFLPNEPEEFLLLLLPPLVFLQVRPLPGSSHVNIKETIKKTELSGGFFLDD